MKPLSEEQRLERAITIHHNVHSPIIMSMAVYRYRGHHEPSDLRDACYHVLDINNKILRRKLSIE